MGGVQSATTQGAVINDAIVNVVMEYAMSCQQAIDATQSVVVGGLNMFSDTSASIKFSASCLGNFQISNEIANKMTAAVQNAITQNNIALLPSISVQDTSTVIKNAITSNITNKMIQTCVTTLKSAQNIVRTGINIGSDVMLSQDIVSKCIMNGVSSTSLATDLLGSAASKTVQSSTNPFSFITDLFSNISFIIAGFIALFILLIMI